MSSIRETENEFDIEIVRFLELEDHEYDKLKKIRLEIEKKEILEKIYAKDMHREIEKLKEIETENIEKILRGLKILVEQEIELETKKQKKEDKIKEYKILIDIIISKAEY